MTSVTIVDYGVGNLFSVAQAIQHCGAEAKLATSPEDILAAEKIILPGVGAFGKAIDKVRERGFDGAMCDFAASNRPMLGICLGMQMLFEDSCEHGSHHGLGLIPGTVMKIPPRGITGKRLRKTHIGWAELNMERPNPLFAEVSTDQAAYFVHSFAAHTGSENVVATVDFHGHRLTAAVARDNVMGVQFHPEKSGQFGIRIIKRFVDNLWPTGGQHD